MCKYTLLLMLLTVWSAEATLNCLNCGLFGGGQTTQGNTQTTTTNQPQSGCNCPVQPTPNFTCNCNCNCNYPNNSQTPYPGECRDPQYNICFNPRSNALNICPYPLTLQQRIKSAPAFVSAVQNTSVSANWDGICVTNLMLSSNLYLQVTAITLKTGSYRIFVALIADEPNNPGSYVTTRNTNTAQARAGYRTLFGINTVSDVTYYGLYSFASYGNCTMVNQGAAFYDLVYAYPKYIPLSDRTLGAQLIKQYTNNFFALGYNNPTYCVTSIQGVSIATTGVPSCVIQLSLP